MPHYLITGLLPDDFDPSSMDEAAVRAINELPRAIALTKNLRERELLTERLSQIEKILLA
ncbi:MAG TPA: hypothetical protein VN717_07425 [Gemmatimonadaceae bacterium]|nr:hypothetical protein [Gemmatimonadaceae bacterium]